MGYQYLKAVYKIWVTQFIEIIKYDFNKGEWKEKVKKAVLKFGKEKSQVEAKEKSTLKYLNPLYNICPHVLCGNQQQPAV